MSGRRHLLLYDGVCGLCNRMNGFVLRRDRRDAFRFAALQGDVGRGWLARLGKDPDDLSTFYVVRDYDGPAPHLLARGRAGIFVLREVGGVWKLAGVLSILPDRVLDWAYDAIARRRYRWFGHYESCPLPAPGTAAKFLDGGG